jgi:flagellin
MANAVQRIRELAVQAVNSTNSTDDRTSLQQEVSQLQAEITRVAGTKFNGTAIIGAGATSFAFQIGPDAGNRVSVITSNIASDATGYSARSGGSIGTQGAASDMIVAADSYLKTINSLRARFGAVQNRFEAIIRNGQNVAENLSASRSRIRDADFAQETASLTRSQILQQAGIAMLSQANSSPQSVLSLLG